MNLQRIVTYGLSGQELNQVARHSRQKSQKMLFQIGQVGSVPTFLLNGIQRSQLIFESAYSKTETQ